MCDAIVHRVVVGGSIWSDASKVWAGTASDIYSQPVQKCNSRDT